jgi:hypothetical protein
MDAPQLRRDRGRRAARLAGVLVVGLAVALAVVVLAAAPAGAHALGGVQPSNYRTRILAVRPAVGGLDLRVVDAGRRLQLTNTGPGDVTVLGYQWEPWLRVGPAGVYENTRSPAVALAGPRRVDAQPPAADPNVRPSWRRLSGASTVAWHDHRIHWEAAQAPAEVRRAPGAAHVVVPRWTVKLRAGGQVVDVVGDVRWVPGPSPLPWLALAVLLGAAVVAAGRRASFPAGVVAATGALVAVDVVHTAATWAGVQDPLAGKLLATALPAGGWLAAALSVRQLLRGRTESGLFQLLFAVGLLTLVGGFGDLGDLFRSQLASALPGWAVRAAVAAKLGLGGGAAVAAGLRLRELLGGRAPHAHAGSDPDEGGGEPATVIAWPGPVSPHPPVRGGPR